MADGLDEFFGRQPGRPRLIAFECDIITPDVADPADQVDVKERNGNKMIHRDCRWSAHSDDTGPVYPSKGDRALLLLSDEGMPWIVEWTSYAQ